ncbi:MAG: ammonium transporter [Propionibacteriaceae bacterium]|nr:ammonium transporter [Propionibacteriaceae bacterium]
MSVWFLLGAALVFFMQCGFAMVESGFTRAKNAGNIIMKNTMDFCIGTVAFVLLGFSIMCAEDYAFGFIGIPNLDIFTSWASFDFSGFVFNLVFCATAATIVSGAMAERTNFIAYIAYSFLISLVVYPVEAGWVWNPQGWLFTNGYIDFAGSSAIHMVGGTMALIGAAILGPRIGKYGINADGKKVAKAIPGHSITLGALGVFILWFGWYGFNGAAAADATQLGWILLTTTLAPAIAANVTMLFTWIKDGRPDVSMTLNGALGGLVGITAPCANVDALGAIIIGAVAGLLIPISVEFIDKVLHVDDPVGAVAVHGVCGIWGTLAAGLFAIDGVGLFYGGGFAQLGVQLAGVGAILAWTAITITVVFFLIDKTIGLRAKAEDELQGLDISEHGLVSAYADFLAAPDTSVYYADAAVTPLLPDTVALAAPTATVDAETAIPVVRRAAEGGTEAGKSKFSKVEIITRPQMLEPLKLALENIGVTGMTVTNVVGHGLQQGRTGTYRGVAVDAPFVSKVKVETVVSLVPVSDVIATAKKVLYTGTIGDGKIFVTDVENVVKIRTGEEGYDALQDYVE